MSNTPSERKIASCSWLKLVDRFVAKEGVTLRFGQGVCRRDGANCIPNRFEQGSDCPDQSDARRYLLIARGGEVCQVMGQATTIITRFRNDSGIRRSIG